MAISLRTAGTWSYAASGSITPTNPTHQTGDILIARVAMKSSAISTCDATCSTSGWAKIGETAGTNNSGNGTGSVLVAAFYKVATSAAETNPQIDFSQANTQAGACVQAYQLGAGEAWVTPVGDGGLDEGTANTSHSATIASHVSVTSGDLVDFFTGIRDDCTMTVPTITQAGVTFAAVVESPATAGSDTSGADGAYDGGYRLASSGTSSAAAVVTGTLSTAEQGSSFMTRLRVQTSTNAPAGNAAGTGTAYNVTTVQTATAGNASGTGAANAPQAGIGPTAGHASGTGSAFDATVQTGAAAPAGNAAGTGTAYGATTIQTANAQAAAATAIAYNPSIALAVNALLASGTGQAFNATVQTTVPAGLASGTGQAFNATGAATVPAGHASGTGAANAPQAGLGVNAGHASGTGQAFDATVQTSSGTDAPAGLASGTGQAFDATVTTGGAAPPSPGPISHRRRRKRKPWLEDETAHDELEDIINALLL